jgi:hypothetical protein
MIGIFQAVPTYEDPELRMKNIITAFDNFQATSGF